MTFCDLYHGKVTAGPEEACSLVRGLPRGHAVPDLQGAFACLYGRQDVDRDHIGSIGWSTGGGLSLELAIHQPRLATCVVNYGVMPTDPNDIQQIFAPVLGNFGADDRGITPDEVRDFEKTMKEMRRRIDVKIYDGAGHGFENSTNTNAYRPEATADTWTRTIAFLNKSLK